MKRLYLAGKMTGLPQFGFPLFDQASRDLRSRGYVVVSPSELDSPEHRKAALASPDGDPALYERETGETWADLLARDIKLVADDCDAVCVLDNWTDSKGAALEVFVARLCGKPVLAYPDLALVTDEFVRTSAGPVETVLQEADRLVSGDRGAAYGHPLDDFTRTGRMWGAILGSEDVTPEQIGLCMAALKISRECNAHKRDNLTDLAGYAKTVDMVVEERERRCRT